MNYKEDYSSHIEEILQSNNPYEVVEEITTRLKTEEERRRQFYNDIDEDSKAEFINGKVIMHSPVRLYHLKISMALSNLIYNHLSNADLGEVFTEKAMIELTRNSYEPDIVYFSKEKYDQFNLDQMLFPAPDFIVEILSKSTKKNDRGIKYKDYESHGVSEYWIIDPDEKSIEQYHLEEGKYKLELKVNQSATLKSRAIKGLVINWQDVFE